MILTIKTREQALTSIRFSSITMIGIAAFLIFASAFFSTPIWEGVLLSLLGLVLLFSKSRVAAIISLVYSVYLFAPIFSNFTSFLNGGGEIFISILLIFASLKAIEATHKLHNFLKEQN